MYPFRNLRDTSIYILSIYTRLHCKQNFIHQNDTSQINFLHDLHIFIIRKIDTFIGLFTYQVTNHFLIFVQ